MSSALVRKEVRARTQIPRGLPRTSSKVRNSKKAARLDLTTSYAGFSSSRHSPRIRNRSYSLVHSPQHQITHPKRSTNDITTRRTINFSTDEVVPNPSTSLVESFGLESGMANAKLRKRPEKQKRGMHAKSGGAVVATARTR